MPPEVDNEDVKTEETQNQETSPEAVTDETETKTEETQTEEESRTIPYAVFKERNEKLRETEKKLKEMDLAREQAVNTTAQQYQTYYESEIAKLQRQHDEQSKKNEETYEEPYETGNPFNEQVGKLNDQIEKMSKRLEDLSSKEESRYLQGEMKNLQATYPEMDKEHVLAIKKMNPTLSLDECAEKSHAHFDSKVKTRYEKMIETKKAAAKKPIFSEEGMLTINSDDTPKTFSEAQKQLMDWAQTEEGI